jgi:predicted alpha/beta hydrolase family esterase
MDHTDPKVRRALEMAAPRSHNKHSVMAGKHQVLFIQGGGAGAHAVDHHLVLSLRRALGTAYEVRYPKMPHEADPDYGNWKTPIGKELGHLKNGAFLVGHSVGGSLLLKYLSDETVNTTLAGICLIATPFWGGDGWRYEGYKAVELPEALPSNLSGNTPICFYHCRDDETVPFAHLALYAKKFPHATIHALDTGGHQLNNDLSTVAQDIKRLV